MWRINKIPHIKLVRYNMLFKEAPPDTLTVSVLVHRPKEGPLLQQRHLPRISIASEFSISQSPDRINPIFWLGAIYQSLWYSPPFSFSISVIEFTVTCLYIHVFWPSKLVGTSSQKYAIWFIFLPFSGILEQWLIPKPIFRCSFR